MPCSLLTKVNTASEGEGRKKRAGEGREGKDSGRERRAAEYRQERKRRDS